MAQEIEVKTDENGIIIWKDEQGNPIKGLQRSWFTEQAKEKTEGLKAFYAYMIARKEVKKVRVAGMLESVDAEIAEYQEKLANVGRELTPEEKALKKIETLKKQLAAAEAAKARLTGEE